MQRLFLKRKANSLQVAHPLQWLDKKNNQSGVFAQARTLMAIEQSVQELLPAGIQPYCRVTQYENGNLTLAVPNNQYASRLRQMAPSLVKGLTKKKWQINKLQLRILQTHHQSIHSPLDTGNKIIRQTSNKTKSRIE